MPRPGAQPASAVRRQDDADVARALAIEEQSQRVVNDVAERSARPQRLLTSALEQGLVDVHRGAGHTCIIASPTRITMRAERQDVLDQQRRQLVAARVERLPAQLLDLAERPAARAGRTGRRTRSTAPGRPARSRPATSSRPSSTRSSASRTSPISSAASRTAQSTGVSPGSSLPPGSMNRDGPALADRQQGAVPEDAHRRGDEDGHASVGRVGRPAATVGLPGLPLLGASATRSPTRSRARPRPPRVRRPRTGPGRPARTSLLAGVGLAGQVDRPDRAPACGPPGTAPAGRPGRRARPCRTCRRCRRPSVVRQRLPRSDAPDPGQPVVAGDRDDVAAEPVRAGVGLLEARA